MSYLALAKTATLHQDAAAGSEPLALSPLVEYVASEFATVVKFSVRESMDEDGDRALIRKVCEILDEHPGANHIVMRAVQRDGSTISVGWRALATTDLRLGIARLLAARAAACTQ